MRVISGKFKGRKLISIKGCRIRPTSDRIKESIFDILGNDFERKIVLDLFAGTGGLGIEALSRGASRAVFIDTYPQAVGVIKKNLAELGLLDCTKIFRRNPLRGLTFLKGLNVKFDIIFLDPPYDKGFADKTMNHISQSGVVAPTATVIAEHSYKEVIGPKVGRLILKDQRTYGKTVISFFEVEANGKDCSLSRFV